MSDKAVRMVTVVCNSVAFAAIGIIVVLLALPWLEEVFGR